MGATKVVLTDEERAALRAVSLLRGEGPILLPWEASTALQDYAQEVLRESSVVNQMVRHEATH